MKLKKIFECPMCTSESVRISYLENARYRFECDNCGQYFELNAPSQLAAQVVFENVIRREAICEKLQAEADDLRRQLAEKTELLDKAV